MSRSARTSDMRLRSLSRWLTTRHPPAAADAPVGAGSDAVSGEPCETSAAVRSASKSRWRIVENSSKRASSPAEQPAAGSPVKRITRKRRTCKRGKTIEKVTSAFAIQPPSVEPCVKQPRRTQKRIVRLSDYVVGNVHVVQGDIEIPTTYKQARASKLLKSLYGLNHAPHIWNKTLHAKLVTMGFERLDSDFGLYGLKKDGEVRMLSTVYVDDLLLMGTPELCTATAAALKESFEPTTIGNVKYLLGHMSTCNGCATPDATSPSKAGLPETNDIDPYRELVGSLQCLVSASRPDIAHTVRHIGKYLSNFDHTHFAEAKRVLRYLQATKDYGLVQDVSKGTSAKLVIYSDADYANDPADRRSTSGYVTMLDGNVISYASRKQEINAMSTCEAEYVAMSEAAKDILWLQG
ncbi:unnamed protein product [Phytophthora fragariaefolia]|uniref:Unnamed protein product n=1 Tax=Phytophthora fragariaefolia TaxID=1490495 RepID=A0A9W7D0B6_9STRA|nr:unnamed protein product [Phytophthora fragariaefolia]